MIDREALEAPILALYAAFRAPVRFEPSDVRSAYRGDPESARRLATIDSAAMDELQVQQRRDIGSNNWVVNAQHTLSGRTLMANDPHRAQAAPSLRYFVHLVAPGWNVIGGGEPVIPGVSIGHNEHGAWGLTIFATDGEDLYVYRTNPANPAQYQYRGAWETMRTVRDSIPVKGQAPVTATFHYTRHGPVVYEDTARHIAYAVRAAWLEPGGAPYLASLRMDQATTWDEFRAACSYSNIPGENMVWADVAGNIGWQAVGIAPIRPKSSGLVPVPGDGRYEWAGYLPILEKPHAFNPPAGFIATANNDLIPPGYPHRDAVGWEWTDPYRFARISEVLGSGRKLSVMDMMRLQTDYTSLPARQLVPLLANLPASDPATERARQALLGWNDVLDRSSVAAGIYEAWYRHLVPAVTAVVVPAPARTAARDVSTSRVVQWLTSPGGEFGAAPLARRDSLLINSLAAAVAELTKRYGTDTAGWAWGRYHTRYAPSSDERRGESRHPLAPRGGTVAARRRRHHARRHRHGREPDGRRILPLHRRAGRLGFRRRHQHAGTIGDVDSRTIATCSSWKNDRTFPVKYTRPAVEGVTEPATVPTPSAR